MTVFFERQSDVTGGFSAGRPDFDANLWLRGARQAV